LKLRSDVPLWYWIGHPGLTEYYDCFDIKEGTILDVDSENSMYYLVEINGVRCSVNKNDVEVINERVDNNIHKTMNIKEKEEDAK